MVTQSDIERVQAEIRPHVMILSIIHLAMMLGAGVYAVFVLKTISAKEGLENQPMESILMFLVPIVTCTVMSFVIPSLVFANLKKNLTWTSDPANASPDNQSRPSSSNAPLADTPAKALMGTMTSTRIIGLALLEGPMFLCSFLASRYSPWWLVGSAILFLLMAIRFPLPRMLAEWIANEEEQLLAG
ncbi:MAG: hypothetical protein ACK553_14050, partial [Planctomycetota bacterium]